MSNQEVDLKPVSMFAITAKLIHHLVQSVQDRFGEEGHELVKKGITHFIDEQKELVEKGSKPYELQEKEIFSYEKLLDPEKVEQTYKNYIHAQDQAGIDKPISIYGIMAKVFAHITKAVVDEYGEQGEEAIKNGVGTFGEERGRHIAKRAAAVGKPNTMENYLKHYDMGRSELFEYETIYHPTEIEQTFTKCAFGDQWKEDGMGKYGILYCQMIDPSIAKGYNPNFEVVHDEYILREGCCHFLFQMKEKKKDRQTLE